MNDSRLVMYHVMDFKKEKQIVSLCRQLGFMTRKLKQSDVNALVGRLAGLKMTEAKTAGAKAPAGYRLPEIIVFSGLSSDVLDRFLTEYKKTGMEPVGLKAVLTLYNSAWSVYELAEELKKERTATLLENPGAVRT